MIAIRGGGLTALMERPTNIRSLVGCSAMSPGTSMSALPSRRPPGSSLRTFPAPISVTYHALPSGSTWMWCGFALSPTPYLRRSTVRRTRSVPGSITETVASS